MSRHRWEKQELLKKLRTLQVGKKKQVPGVQKSLPKSIVDFVDFLIIYSWLLAMDPEAILF